MALLEFVSAYPHPLTFFNVLVGGPTHGFRYLADSNLDWGQDLKGLKSWMGDHEVSRLGLAYFGSADPKYYHIDYSWLPGGVPFFDQVTDIASPPRYVAISTTFYDGVYLTPPWRLFYSAFTALTPVDVIGNSIRIYDVSAGWPHARASGPEKLDAQKSLAGALRQGGWIDEAVIEYTNYLSAKPEDLDAEFGLAEALSGQDDFARAIPHYRAVLVGRPDDVATLTNLGIALAKTGHVHDALVFLRHAVSLRPGDENLQANLARASFNDDDVAGAERAARAALQTSPDDGSTRDILAASLAMQGKGNEARTEFERVLRDNPQDRVANQGLALLGP